VIGGRHGLRVASAIGVSRANDVTMSIAGLVADGTGRRYGDWQHVATGCNTLVIINGDGRRRRQQPTGRLTAQVGWIR